jgi:hypothetical protein
MSLPYSGPVVIPTRAEAEALARGEVPDSLKKKALQAIGSHPNWRKPHP